MLFQVKRLPSINSADQYLVSDSQSTQVRSTSSCPLLLKYQNFEDPSYYVLEQCSSGSNDHSPSDSRKLYVEYRTDKDFSTFPDLNALNDFEDMSNTNVLSQHGLVGLYNLENTCFLNSIVQCLRFTKPLFVYILKGEYQCDLQGNHPTLVEEFSKLVKDLWSFSPIPRSSVSPRPFTKAICQFAPEFDGYTQQDAHEFLLCLLSSLHENLNLATSRWPAKTNSTDVLQGHTMWQNYLSRDNSRIIDIFVGQLRSTLICLHCNKMSSTFDPFWDLSLPIPSCADGTTTIEQCLQACLNDERIDGANMPFCNNCKCRKPCQKDLSIHKLPKVLILHLKRFTEDQEKLNTFVDFPVRALDIGPFCSGGIKTGVAKYNLFAVVNHTGSMSYGHYTAFCYNPLVTEWFEFNDHHVTQLESADNVVTDKAYILLYELWGQSSKL